MKEVLQKAMQQQQRVLEQLDALEQQGDADREHMLELCVELLNASNRCSALLQVHVKELVFDNSSHE